MKTNKKSTKRALIASVISLLLCFTMLMGTTYAWFTDSVTSTNNIIKTGNLDVELRYYGVIDETTGEKGWIEVDENTNVFSGQLWEPGHTEVVYLKVSNLGTLALKYQLGINVASETTGLTEDNKEIKLSEIIKFGVDDGMTPTYESREKAREAVETDAKVISEGYSKSSTLLPATEGNESSEYVALVVYMPETTGNEANYRGETAPKIDLGINLMAAQYTSETDSFDEKYDENAEYDGIVIPADAIKISSYDEFVEAVTNGGNYEIVGSFTVEATEEPGKNVKQGLTVAATTNFYNANPNNVLTFEQNARLRTANNADLAFYGVKINGGGSFTMENGEFTTDATKSNNEAMLMAYAGSTLTLGKGTVVENVVSNCPAVAWATGTVDNRATIILDGATVRNCAGGSGTVVNVDRYGDVYIEEGTVISNNISYNNQNHGIFRIYNDNWDATNPSTLTMNGGEICNNYYSGNGMIGLYYADMTMNGGKITSNSWYVNNEKNNGFYCAIYIYSASHFIMNGGEICNNTIRFGAINSINATIEDCIVINGGTVSNNINTDNNGSDGFAAVCYPNTVEKHFVISEKANVTGTIWNFLDENDARVKRYSEISDFLAE
ncbi:MAG: hypothetical protein IJ011_02600 [Clostridia bacterium]|nr:hypothetical protein [Clostridia bacterium]